MVRDQKIRLCNKKIYKMVVEEKPLNEIASHFGTSEGNVRYIYKQTKRKLPGKNKKRNKEICKKVLTGKSYQQIAIKYGLTKERIRQIYLKSGRTTSLFKEKKKHRNFKRILRIMERYMKDRDVFPSRKEVLKFLISQRASTHYLKIYKELQIKYKNLPKAETEKKQKKKEILLNDLKQLYDIVKTPISPALHFRKFKLMSKSTYKWYFGTVKNACNIAGVPSVRRGRFGKEKNLTNL